MSTPLPRISLRVTLGEEDVSGDLSSMFFGYALHQAWVYSTMFATSTIFAGGISYSDAYGNSVSMPSLISMIVFAVTLLTCSFFDRQVGMLLQKPRIITFSAVVTCLGTLMMIIPDLGASSLFIILVSGLLTGIGSATLILAWGDRFARSDSLGIILNTGLSVAVGFILYAAIITALPYPISAIVVSLIPVAEAGLLLVGRAALSSSTKEGIPPFNPLPVSRLSFFLRFGVPVFVFGLALGILRRSTLQTVLTASNAQTQSAILAAAGLALLLFFMVMAISPRKGGVRQSFRVLVPIIAIGLLMLPSMSTGGAVPQMAYAVAAYICFEALMWTLFSETAQNYRISPVLAFGCGRGFLAAASVLGALATVYSEHLVAMVPLNGISVLAGLLVIMVCAYSLLPNHHEIAAMIVPSPSHDPAPSVQAPEGDTTPQSVNEEAREDLQPTFAADQKGNTASHNQPLSNSQAGTTATPTAEQSSLEYLRTRCETVSNTYLLSTRESEILLYLARGYNAAYIQEKLYISEGTAKTHLRHIYRKLNIHSQQELMRLVESA